MKGQWSQKDDDLIFTKNTIYGRLIMLHSK